MAIEIRAGTEVPMEAVKRLYEIAGWWVPGADEERLPRLVRGSFCFASAYDGGELVGIGRAISDGASDAYIQDVMVRPDHRGLGIGSAIVAFLRDWCQGEGIAWIGLIAAPGTREFYDRLGFRAMEAHVPMLLGTPGTSR